MISKQIKTKNQKKTFVFSFPSSPVNFVSEQRTDKKKPHFFYVGLVFPLLFGFD